MLASLLNSSSLRTIPENLAFAASSPFPQLTSIPFPTLPPFVSVIHPAASRPFHPRPPVRLSSVTPVMTIVILACEASIGGTLPTRRNSSVQAKSVDAVGG